MTSVQVALSLDEDTAYALAELCKRIPFSDARSNAVDDSEAYRMLEALDNVRKGLEGAGVYVR